MKKKFTDQDIRLKPGDNGLQVRLHNRRVQLWNVDDGWVIRCKKLSKEKQIIYTDMALSDEAMEYIVKMYVQIWREKHGSQGA